MRELKPYLRRSLTTSCPLKYFLWTNAGNTDNSTSRNNFQFWALNCPAWKEAWTCYRERRRIDSNTASSLAVYACLNDFTATNFDISSSIFRDTQVKIFHARLTETISRISTTCSYWDKFRYKSFLTPCLYSTWFTFVEFVSKLVVACSFWVARVIKNTRRKPFEFKWPEVRF